MSDPALPKVFVWALVAHVLTVFKEMNEHQRLEAIDLLRDRYCLECGSEQPTTGRRCQCWNDE